MIRLAQEINDLRALCADAPFGCQILSAAEAYGLERSFAFFWKDSAAAYGKLDGVMRICGTITDAEEAAAFLRAVGAESVVCSAENAERLGLNVTERGVILYKDLPEAGKAERPAREEIPLRQVYEVLKSCGMVGEFEPFYLDLSHRVRHKTAVCAATCCFEVTELFGHGRSLCRSVKNTEPTRTEEASEIQAVAVAVFGEGCSLISAVAVRPEFQRQGLGTQIVRKMEEKLSGRVYLLRAESENERFYARLGYKPCGAWCVGILG